MKAILCGGGFGGHVSMAVAVGQALRGLGVEGIGYMGCRNYIEHRIVTRETNFPFHDITVSSIPRRSTDDGEKMLNGYAGGGDTLVHLGLRHVRWPVQLVFATLQSFRHLRRVRPDVVVSTGAVVSAPVVAAARAASIPILIHEANEIPGRVNRKLSRFASVVTAGGPGPQLHLERPTVVTGNPVRQEFEEPCDQHLARCRLGLDPRRPTLLITGGSLGAPPLNRAALGAARRIIIDLGMQIVHQTGDAYHANHLSRIQESTAGVAGDDRYRTVPYLSDFRVALSAADVVVTRAGAATIAEVECLGKKAILVPYSAARDDHQSQNAREAEKRGVGRTLSEDRLTSDSLYQAVATSLGAIETRRDRSAAVLGAARCIAKIAVSIAHCARGDGVASAEL